MAAYYCYTNTNSSSSISQFKIEVKSHNEVNKNNAERAFTIFFYSNMCLINYFFSFKQLKKNRFIV